MKRIVESLILVLLLIAVAVIIDNYNASKATEGTSVHITIEEPAAEPVILSTVQPYSPPPTRPALEAPKPPEGGSDGGKTLNRYAAGELEKEAGVGGRE